MKRLYSYESDTFNYFCFTWNIDRVDILVNMESFEKFQAEFELLLENQSLPIRFYEHLKAFHDFFMQENSKMNLMGPGAVQKIWSEHFYDCLIGFKLMDLAPQKRFIDLGTGGGFPGILLKIFQPELQLTLVESRGKKAAFLERALLHLGLKNAVVLQEGIENISKNPKFRSQFDGITARALAELEQLIQWTRPLLKPAGKAYFYKSDSWEIEIKNPKSRETIDAQDISHHGLGRKLILYKPKAWEFLNQYNL